jgi:hypothetical protein
MSTVARLKPVVAERLWVAEAPASVLGVELGTRMSVVRLEDGGLFLHSPVDLDDALRAELAALGPVRCVVAPNKLHYLSVHHYFGGYPEAKIYAAPGLEGKLEQLSFHGVLGDRPEEAWAADLDQVLFAGAPAVQEVVFFHRATRTLILTDLCFFIPADSPFGTRLFAQVSGVLEKLSPSRAFRAMIRDRAAARASLERILAWDFDRILLTHGRLVETGGHPMFRQAFTWLLEPR